MRPKAFHHKRAGIRKALGSEREALKHRGAPGTLSLRPRPLVRTPVSPAGRLVSCFPTHCFRPKSRSLEEEKDSKLTIELPGGVFISQACYSFGIVSVFCIAAASGKHVNQRIWGPGNSPHAESNPANGWQAEGKLDAENCVSLSVSCFWAAVDKLH